MAGETLEAGEMIVFAPSNDAINFRARNLEPGARLLCDSALFSHGVSGMAASRHTFQQAVLALLAGLGQIVLRRATRETGLRNTALYF